MENHRAPPPPAELKQLRRVSRLMDSSVPLPGGFRVGLDGLVGLIPGVGDVFGAGMSSWIIYQAWRMGVPWSVLLRMLVNAGLDALIGLIPVAGDLFDFAWKANSRNVALVERYFEQPKPTRRNSTFRVLALSVVVFAFGAVVLWLLIVIVGALWQALAG